MHISINSRTSGKFRREMINGRSHIITEMMPIRGDTTMNGLFYPDKEVTNSFSQLEMLPAPNGHPKVNGVHVPAFHPVANNAQNIGAFLRKPRKKGKRVVTEVLIDEVVANQTDDGKELIKRIETNGKVGVSTGLSIDQVVNESGVDDFNKPFTRVGHGFQFDHVAILLNEQAAGEHAGTEMILNTDDKDEPIYIVNGVEERYNELTADEIHTKLVKLIRTATGDDIFRQWVQEIFPESRTFIFSDNDKLFKQDYAIDSNDDVTLLGERVEVERKTEFIQTNNEGKDMNKELLVLAIIANAANAFTVKDKDRLTAMSEPEIVNALSIETDEATARQIITDAGFDFDGYSVFQENKEQFDSFLVAEKTRLDEIKESITTNSDYTPELLEGKTEAELNVLNSLSTKSVTNKRAPDGKAPESGDNVVNVDFSMEG